MSLFRAQAFGTSLGQVGSGLQLAVLRIVVGVHLLTVFGSPVLPLLASVGAHPHPMTSSAIPAALEALVPAEEMPLLGGVGMLAACAMIAGLFTRAAIVLALLAFLITQNYWFRSTVFHDDWLYLVFPLLTLACSDCADRLALDARLRKRSPRRGAQRQAYRWPLELIASWFAFVYVSAGVAKLFPLRKGVLWLSGRSVQQFAVEFLPDSPIFWLTGHSLFDYRLVWPFCIASWLTALVELSAGAMIFLPRARWVFWLALLGMHVGIWCMGIPGFVQLALVFAIAMLPVELFRDAAAVPISEAKPALDVAQRFTYDAPAQQPK
ncbi:MAG TPA: HTTM domain-containing protein [Polyangiales bacterium]|nr:HTTM domain-containing protein [Polyangiales bacterium]